MKQHKNKMIIQKNPIHTYTGNELLLPVKSKLKM